MTHDTTPNRPASNRAHRLARVIGRRILFGAASASGSIAVTVVGRWLLDR